MAKDALTKDEKHLKSLDRFQVRYLSRFACMWCDYPLNLPGCGAIYKACNNQARINRREKALKEYKPRPSRRRQ